MTTVSDLLAALHADPADHGARLALADALLEARRDGEAEVARLHARQLMRVGSPEELARLCALLEGGVRPVVPEVVNSVGMRFALIPPGAFLMGSPEGEADRGEDEGPQHEVRLTRPFYLGVFPVTQAEYREVMGDNPSDFSAAGAGRVQVEWIDTSRFPVEWVSHAHAVRFCERLTEKERQEGTIGPDQEFCLPSEAQWEHSCRGGAAAYQPFHTGDSLSSHQANFDGHYPYGGAERGEPRGQPCSVGSYAPNAFGLYDMHGNVWEWCQDWYGAGYYARSPSDDPPGPRRGSDRVLRGASWYDYGQHCRSAYRNKSDPANRDDNLGFRVSLVPSGGRGGAEAGGGERRRRSDRRRRSGQ